jgi:hypothetical protein
MRSAIGRGKVCGVASELPLVIDLLIERDRSPTRGSLRLLAHPPAANPPGTRGKGAGRRSGCSIVTRLWLLAPWGPGSPMPYLR